MTRYFRAAVLATAVILTPAAASATIRTEVAPRASTPVDRSPLSAPFPNMIHWAMIAVGTTFVGVALYIHRRRGFEID